MDSKIVDLDQYRRSRKIDDADSKEEMDNIENHSVIHFYLSHDGQTNFDQSRVLQDVAKYFSGHQTLCLTKDPFKASVDRKEYTKTIEIYNAFGKKTIEVYKIEISRNKNNTISWRAIKKI